jgi:hypothetical protein
LVGRLLKQGCNIAPEEDDSAAALIESGYSHNAVVFFVL